MGKHPNAKGLGQGMAQMFKMINESRINTGHSALAVATVAYNNSVAYAMERVQGKLLCNPKAGRVPIIQHEDVRRMLLTQKAVLEGMRAMIFKGYYYMDQISFGQDDSEVLEGNRRIEIITPLIKAYCSDQAWNLIAEAIQVHGGYGFTEEYPVARQARDSKVYSIWEGTNFIQALVTISDSELSFYQGKIFSARFYVRNIVPDVIATVSVIKEEDSSAIDIPEDAFSM